MYFNMVDQKCESWILFFIYFSLVEQVWLCWMIYLYILVWLNRSMNVLNALLNSIQKVDTGLLCKTLFLQKSQNRVPHVRLCSVHCTVCTVYSNALVPDPLDPQDFGFLDPDPDPRGKISTKNCKKNFFTAKTQILTFEKKWDYKNFLISEWFIKF